MAGFIRPDDRWLIDWNDTGLYDHTYSDVTPYYHSYIVRYGADTESNPAEVNLTKAQGILRLEDSANRFDPGSAVGIADIGARQLRQGHLCKLEAQFVRPLFDMNISPPPRAVGGYIYRSDTDPTVGSASSSAAKFDWQDVPWEMEYVRWTNFRFQLKISPDQTVSGQDIISRLNASDPGWYVQITWPSLEVPARTYEGSGWSLAPGETDLIQTNANFSPIRGRAGIEFRLQIIGSMKQIMWEGTAVPTTGRRLVAEDFADFDLESRHYDQYRTPAEVPVTDGGTLNDFLTSGMPSGMRNTRLDSRMNLMNIGRGEYEGTNQGFINAAARYAAGWAYETRRGKVGIVSWGIASVADTDDHVDRRFRPRIEGHLFEHRPKYVKNYAEPQAVGVVTGRETVLEEETFDTAEEWPSASLRATGGAVRYLSWADSDGNTDTLSIHFRNTVGYADGGVRVAAWQRIQTWTDDLLNGWRFNLNPGLWNQNTKRGQDSISWVDYPNIPFGTASARKDTQLRFRLLGKRRKLGIVRGVGEQRTSPSPDAAPKQSSASVADFGQIQLEVPTWYPDRSLEFSICNAFVYRLGDPLRYVRLVLGRYHKQEEYVARIADLEAGQIVDVTLRDVDNNDLLVKMVILGIQYEKGLDQSPTKTIYGFTVEEGSIKLARWQSNLAAQGAFKWIDDPDTTDPQVGFWRD